ncbi:PREDICTED: uncharacterized protein LOC106818647 [Priapulus caudatus]|uniref:Uncharacterized protein LOC106818647 n=1 Tax=Priapulus caudatus TaxID=37621 RepID=A0ABM1F302_PRICU|nr:PREDICTED: uncharacterized protein LOC106818647 [Priapulus caudatus]
MKTAGPRASLALLVVGCLLAATATTTAFATMMHQSDGVNVYDEFVKLFNSRAITLESVQLIRQNLLARLTYCSTSPHVCDDCLPTETLFDIAANVSDIDAGLDESQFHRVSVVMFYAALYPERVCRAPSLDYLDYRVGMLSAHREPTQQADTFSVQQLREILRQINATYTATRSHGLLEAVRSGACSTVRSLQYGTEPAVR